MTLQEAITETKDLLGHVYFVDGASESTIYRAGNSLSLVIAAAEKQLARESHDVGCFSCSNRRTPGNEAPCNDCGLSSDNWSPEDT